MGTIQHQSFNNIRVMQAHLQLTAPDWSSLPTEVLHEIGRFLKRKDLSSFGQVSKHVHTATLPLLFGKLTSSIDLRKTGWIRTALKAVDPDTWRHLKEMRLQVAIPLNRHMLEMDKVRSKAAKPGDWRNEWRSFFRLLQPLTRLSISILDVSESAEAARDIPLSPYWFDYTGLLRESEPLSNLIPAANLIITVHCGFHTASDHVQHLLASLKKGYLKADAVVRIRTPQPQSSNLGLAQLAEALSGDWIHSLDLQASSEIRALLPFQNISTLSLTVQDSSVTPGWWQVFQRLSSSLKTLYIDETIVSRQIIPARPDTITLSNVTFIQLNGSSLSTGLAIVKMACLPCLEIAEVSLDCTGIMQEALGEERAVEHLLDLVSFNQALPPHCRRAYDVYLTGTLYSLQVYQRMLLPLVLSSCLCLGLHIDWHMQSLPEPHNQVPGQDMLVPCDFKALVGAFTPELQASVRSLKLHIQSDTVSRPVGIHEMILPDLRSLTLYIPEDNAKWSTHIVHQVFASLSVPAVFEVCLVSKAPSAINSRFSEMLEIFLPHWPSLKQVVFDTGGIAAIESALDVTSLQAACKARKVLYKSSKRVRAVY